MTAPCYFVLLCKCANAQIAKRVLRIRKWRLRTEKVGYRKVSARQSAAKAPHSLMLESAERCYPSLRSFPRLMLLIINGESRDFPAPLSVAALLETLGYTGKRIAVERNGEIVPKSRHDETALVGGDRLEIVIAVGGG